MSEELKIYPINNNYAISSDGKYNIILMEKYAKREGLGKNAPLTGEYGYKPIKYYSTIQALAQSLVQLDVLKGIEEVGLDKLIDYIEEQKKVYETFFTEKIAIQLGKVKDIKEEE